MGFDKKQPDGTEIKAPGFTYGVLESVPILFQIVEWLLVIVAFQYVDTRFGYIAAKITWIILGVALGVYIAVLLSNIAWRTFKDPFGHRGSRFFITWILPALTGSLVFVLLKVVVEQMVKAQAGTA